MENQNETPKARKKRVVTSAIDNGRLYELLRKWMPEINDPAKQITLNKFMETVREHVRPDMPKEPVRNMARQLGVTFYVPPMVQESLASANDANPFKSARGKKRLAEIEERLAALTARNDELEARLAQAPPATSPVTVAVTPELEARIRDLEAQSGRTMMRLDQLAADVTRLLRELDMDKINHAVRSAVQSAANGKLAQPK